MKILITGAAGYLCTEAIAQLAARGHQLRLGDIREFETPHEFVRCDVLNVGDLFVAMKGMDVVFHTVVGGSKAQSNAPKEVATAASRHFAVSVMGAFNVLQAAKAVGVPKVVIVTSEAARGQRIPITDVEVCDEETPAKPDYVYALAKYVQEIIAEYATRIDGVKTVCLRNGWFGLAAGRSLKQFGETLLYQRSVTRKDMVRAAVLAIENDGLEHEVFLLCNTTEFTREDVPMLRTNPSQAIEKHYPGAVALLTEYGIDLEALYRSKNLWKIDDVSKAERLLGWKPTFTFRDFYENLKAGKYPKGYVFVEPTSTPADLA